MASTTVLATPDADPTATLRSMQGHLIKSSSGHSGVKTFEYICIYSIYNITCGGERKPPCPARALCWGSYDTPYRGEKKNKSMISTQKS